MAQTKLLNITWTRGSSPYGTYVAGDVVDVYWDLATNALVVKKNDVVITTGSDIPTVFGIPRRGSSNIYLKAEVLYQSQICDDQDLIQFGRITAFPYLNFLKLQNHLACDITGTDLVCDLHFTALPIITPCSTPTASDGTITVAATSSFGTVKYRLNLDFEFNSGLGRGKGRDLEIGIRGTSNPVFTGLPPGNYVIYARDAKNCLAIISCSVPVTKTYGTIAQLEFYNPIAYHIKTEILELGYSGSVTEVTGQDIPVHLSKRGEGERDKFYPLMATEILFNLVALTEGQFSYVYTNNPDKYRIRLSIDTDGGYQVVWLGRVLPQQYTSSYNGDKDKAHVIATCGLAWLKNFPFRDDNGNRLVGSFKQIEIIAWILRKLNLGLSIKVGINMYAEDMDITAADDPLDQAYVDVLTYYLLDENISCVDVLKHILKPYVAQITQYGNYWNITKVPEKCNTYAYRVFDVNGLYVSNASYNPVKNVKAATLSSAMHWADNNARMELLPGFGHLRLIYHLGRKPNIFDNGDFTTRKFSVLYDPIQSELNWEGLAPDITGFQVVNNETVVTQRVETIEGNNVAFVLGCVEDGGYVVTNPLLLKMGSADSLKLTYKFKINANAPIIRGGTVPYVKVKIQVRYGSYYLTDGGQWTTDINVISFIVDFSSLNEFKTLEISAPTPDVAYIDGQYISVKMFIPNLYQADYTSRSALENATTIGVAVDTKAVVSPAASAGGLLTNYIYFYELKEERHASFATKPDIITPVDYNTVTNPVKWVLKYRALKNGTAETFLFIDKVQVEIFSQGQELPAEAVFTKKMEPENPETLIESIYHGSYLNNGQTLVTPATVELPPQRAPENPRESFAIGRQLTSFYPGYYLAYTTFQAESAALVYASFLRNAAGLGWIFWTRDGFSELLPMHSIIADEYVGQYRRPWQKITGNLVSHDTFITPIDIIKDFTGGSNKKYDPVALSINLKENISTGQFLELIDVADEYSDEAVAAFSVGFSVGFKA